MEYKCGTCEAKRVKLWREYQTFLDHQSLYCLYCATKEKGEEKPSVDRPYEIGWLVAAIPTDDDSFWGYTSVPSYGMRWWDALPVSDPLAVVRFDLDSDHYTSLMKKFLECEIYMKNEEVRMWEGLSGEGKVFAMHAKEYAWEASVLLEKF